MTETSAPFVLTTLKNRKEFLSARHGPFAKARGFVLQSSKPSTTPREMPRFGFTVTKKVGNAVVRNRIKRRLREVVRTCGSQNPIVPNDYVLIGKQAALKLPFETMVADLARGLDRVTNSRENLQKPNHS